MNSLESALISLRAFTALVGMAVIGVPLLVVALVLLTSPDPSRRRLARVFLAIDAAGLLLLVVALVPEIQQEKQADRRQRAYDSRTMHLAEPQLLAGVAFPAGSTVHLNEDGSIDKGALPVPTLIDGLPLIGDFESSAMTLDGTLAAPAEVAGVPCAAGAVRWYKGDSVDCTLEHGIAVAGHDLAAGAQIDVAGRMLYAGRLAHAELLFDVLWPAGTVLHGTSASPEQLAHASAPTDDASVSRDGKVSLCPPGNQTVQVPGIMLHGKVSYQVANDGSRLVYAGCPDRDQPLESDGYITAGADRHSRGRQANTGSPWQWDDYQTPD